jgi:hypothetical protein
MARWTPQTDETIGLNEYIGRRLFDEPMLTGAKNQRPFNGLRLSHFEETRGDEVSLDRLGRTSIEKKVINYVGLRAEAAAKTRRPSVTFNGWAVLRARQFHEYKHQQLTVVPSPVIGNDFDENIYHAHVNTPSNIDSYSMALHLKQLFTDHGIVIDPLGKEVKQTHQPLSSVTKLISDWLSKSIQEIFKK